jgi:hypothetical protein
VVGGEEDLVSLHEVRSSAAGASAHVVSLYIDQQQRLMELDREEVHAVLQIPDFQFP